ncbi:LysE family translocator [Roseospirillum parvum]|uniref:Threonine/homoserine/homoserine lactone efflux protein n=1 Tax=Roseospirillum parvum TaxID=83401 RepID=A0A1G7X4B2_9PROT|nr:LysE family translocator [Roseospirillum parvum]SDG78947.1 Threonine/homoserine/homoserine lactone efflux protein [Roseospirillum parvum]
MEWQSASAPSRPARRFPVKSVRLPASVPPMANDLLLLWLAALPLMGSPGPATMSLAGLGTAFGFRQSLGYLVGIIIGTTVVLLMIATGVTAVVLTQPILLTALTILAGAYILYLAWKIATAPVGGLEPRAKNRNHLVVPDFSLRSALHLKSRAGRAKSEALRDSHFARSALAPRPAQAPSFVPGFSLAIANPKAFAAIGAVYAGHTLVADDPTVDALYKLVALTLVIVIVNTAWLAFGALFSRVLTNPVAGRAVNIIFAIMLVVSVGLALVAA